jgi:two-component system, NtrC family, response regulator HydG
VTGRAAEAAPGVSIGGRGKPPCGAALPPLPERREDIIPLAVHLVERLADRHRRDIRTISDDARRTLLAHDWPGNVRELRNALERAIVLAEGTEVTAADLPATLTDAAALLGPTDAALAGLAYTEAREHARAAFDRAFLGAALERHGGNISRTAEALGPHRQSLQKLLKKVGLRAE